MSAPFAFPPPPPPPPKAYSQDYGSTASSFQDNLRGGRDGRGARGRGRGQQRGGSSRGGYGNPFPRHAETGHSHGGASYNAQAPMTGVPQSHQYLSGYPLPQYPQQQQAQPAFQHPFPQAPTQYTQPAAEAAQVYSQLHSLLNASAAYAAQSQQPPYNPNTPQTWPVPNSQPQSDPNIIGPPIRMGFGEGHGPAGGFPTPDHHASNAFYGNKRKREGSFGDSYSTHHGHNGNPRRGRQQQGQPYGSKLSVAPPVPSFGFALPALPEKPPPPAGQADGFSKRNKKRKFNQLGLTPRGETHEDSENEMDEEAGVAATDGFLSFQYKGQTSTLGSSAEIDAWIEERKKRFPTKARVERKRQEDLRRMQEREEARKKALKDVQNERKKEKEIEREKKRLEKPKEEGQPQTALEKDLLKAEKLRRKLAKIEAKTAKAAAASAAAVASTSQTSSMPETAMPLENNKYADLVRDPNVRIEHDGSFEGPPLQQAGVTPGLRIEVQVEPLDRPPEGTVDDSRAPDPTVRLEEVLNAQRDLPMPSASQADPRTPAGLDLGLAYESEEGEDAVVDNSDSMSVSSSDISSDSASSSSDRSDAESDGAPDREPSRRTAPARVPAPDRNACKFFMKTGRCRYGDKCRYRHELRENKPKTRKDRAEDGRSHAGAGRVRLHDRLVEQEQSQQDRLVLQAIKHLGGSGFLD